MTTLLQIERSPARQRRKARGAETRAITSTLTVLTFNIGAAAPPRADAILRWLRSRTDDVVVLTETSDGAGTDLLAEGLCASGYNVRVTRGGGERGVLLASRIDFIEDFSEQVAVTVPSRMRTVVLDTKPRAVALVGVYVPSRDRSDEKVARKQVFIASMLASLRQLPDALRERLVLAGDYNVVARRHQPPLPGFFPWEYGLHDELEEFGLRSAHELRPRADHPHSWIGRTGLRYLYDYIHVGSSLHGGVERCAYLHGPRERRLSDHAAVVARLRVA
jgi:exodeoxyribonuclease-3